MCAQLQMVWPKDRLKSRPERPVPEGYQLRSFREGDEDAYIQVMRMAGFTSWGSESLNAVVEDAIPDGIFFVEETATLKIVATAMCWHRPTAIFPDGYEMGWVAADSAHSGKGLGRIVTAAATRALLEHGARQIYLLTDDFRLPGIKSYLSVGYLPLFHEPDMRERWQKVCSALGLNVDDCGGVDIESPGGS